MRRLLLLALMAGALGACTAQQPTSVESASPDAAVAPTAALVPEEPAPADTAVDPDTAPPEEPAPKDVKSEPASSGDAKALAGAKQLVRSLTEVDGIGDMAELMTNDTAAMMGMGILGMLGMMTQSLADGDGATALIKDLEAIAKRYGLSPPGSDAPPSFDRVRKQGRAFLKEVAKLMAKTAASQGESGPDPFSGMGKKIYKDLEDVTYTVVDSEHVRIEREGQPVKMEARLVDGKWRLHQPGAEKMGQMMQGRGGRSSGMAPPGKGGPPGLPPPPPGAPR